MVRHVGLTLDCLDASRLADFWKRAVGYVDEPPPAPFRTREEWVEQFDEEDEGLGGAWLHDPTGVAPRLCLLEVPEPKTVKNRLHLDLRVSDGGGSAQPYDQVLEEVGRLVAAGASVVAHHQGHHVVMADPEGNEFCLS